MTISGWMLRPGMGSLKLLQKMLGGGGRREKGRRCWPWGPRAIFPRSHNSGERKGLTEAENLPQRGLYNIISVLAKFRHTSILTKDLVFLFLDKSSANEFMRKIEGRRPKRHAREGSLQSPRGSEKTAVGLPLRGSVYITNSWRAYLLGLWAWIAAATFVWDLASGLVS